MAKQLASATVVLVALFLAIAEVSCFRTIVTTTIEEVEQGQGQQDRRCRQQVQQRYQQLRSCKNYLEPSGGNPFELEMVVNQQRREEQQQQQQCCQQLRQLGDCSCQAIQQIVEEEVRRFQQGQQGQQEQEGQWPRGQGQGQQHQQQQMQHILQRARNLPQECGLRQQCDIQTPSYYYYY